MKAITILKSAMFAMFFVACSLNANADNKSSLIYNAEEVNGVKVGEVVYKMNDNALVNYMKYNYKYDDQNRMTENESMKWNATANDWVKDVCIRYAYKGKTQTTTYYKWNKKSNEYVLVPEMTITMDIAK